jgi:hypothetical protein
MTISWRLSASAAVPYRTRTRAGCEAWELNMSTRVAIESVVTPSAQT